MITYENNPLKKLLLINYGLSVIILQINLLTDKVRKKKFTCFISLMILFICWYVDSEFNM